MRETVTTDELLELLKVWEIEFNDCRMHAEQRKDDEAMYFAWESSAVTIYRCAIALRQLFDTTC